MTIGVDATKLLITGLDLAADGGYDLGGIIKSAVRVIINVSLNDTDNTGIVQGWYRPTTTNILSSDNPNTLFFSDVDLSHFPLGKLRDNGTGNPKTWQVLEQGNNFIQEHIGQSTLTANVTSLSINNLKAGSVVNLWRIM